MTFKIRNDGTIRDVTFELAMSNGTVYLYACPQGYNRHDLESRIILIVFSDGTAYAPSTADSPELIEAGLQFDKSGRIQFNRCTGDL